MNGTNMNNNGNNNYPMGPFPAGVMPSRNLMGGDDGCLDWDSEISNDGADYLILPEGDYEYQVVDIQRGRHEASGKLPACNLVKLTLEVTTEAGVARAWTEIYLHMSMTWKISAFFRSIGLKKKGEKIQMDWGRVMGARGRAHFRPRTYGSGGDTRQANELIRFIDADMVKMPQRCTDVTDTTEVPF